MSLQGRLPNSKGFTDAQAYAVDPDNQTAPDYTNHEYHIGGVAYTLANIGDMLADILTIQGVTLTTDQKAALDANILLDATNPVASLQDITDSVAVANLNYTYRTGSGTPVSGEMTSGPVDTPRSSITTLYLHDIEANGVAMWNILLKLQASDAITLQANNDATKFANFDVSGDPVHNGNVVEIPVTLFSDGAGAFVDTDDLTVQLHYDGSNTAHLSKASNLSDVQSVVTSRANLGVQSIVEGQVMFLEVSKSLSDIASAPNARTNLGLGDSATKNTGVGGADVAAGDHSHTNLPTDNQKDALNAASAPGSGNPFITNNDMITIGGSINQNGSFDGTQADSTSSYTLVMGMTNSFGTNSASVFNVSALVNDVHSIECSFSRQKGSDTLKGKYVIRDLGGVRMGRFTGVVISQATVASLTIAGGSVLFRVQKNGDNAIDFELEHFDITCKKQITGEIYAIETS